MSKNGRLDGRVFTIPPSFSLALRCLAGILCERGNSSGTMPASQKQLATRIPGKYVVAYRCHVHMCLQHTAGECQERLR